MTDREAKLDDQANIDYQGLLDGVPFEGGTAQGHELVLGSGAFIPGFEDQVVGMKIGEEKDLNVHLPGELSFRGTRRQAGRVQGETQQPARKGSAGAGR